MAKGIRSKSMRKNRAQLRKNLTEPIVRKRQAEIAASIKKLQEEKSGSTILSLQSIIPAAINAPAVSKSKDMIANINDEKDETVQRIPKKLDNMKPKPYKGSKPKHNPKKELVWFK